jgi:hypothetical protein
VYSQLREVRVKRRWFQSLGQEISWLLLRTDRQQFEQTTQKTFTDYMIINLYVLCPFMKNRVVGYVASGSIVTK